MRTGQHQTRGASQKLSEAAAIEVTGLAVGDRVLVQLDPNASTRRPAIVAMKKADVAQKQAQEQQAWQSGVAGLVKTRMQPAADCFLPAQARWRRP